MILSLLLLNSCTSNPIIENKYIEKHIDIQPRPANIVVNKIAFKAMNEGNVVYYKLDNNQYLALMGNLSEIYRYISQQKELIKYYEDSLKPTK